ncbi:MAG: fibronectin type III domain-containing protein, partial [Chloroflexi bacterium]|nr:fibronectin type III domain-containing protein [Chloroflexota bacterium]
MKYTVSSQSWRASARSKIKNLSVLSAIAFVLFAATNAGLLWLVSDGQEQVRADHSQTPNHFEVVPGNSRLHVSWRPDAGHTYELRWRVGDTVASRWNVVTDPGTYRYEITGLANRTEYDVQVRGMAEHSSSSRSTWSDWTRIESAEPRALAGSSNDTPSWRTTVDRISL